MKCQKDKAIGLELSANSTKSAFRQGRLRVSSRPNTSQQTLESLGCIHIVALKPSQREDRQSTRASHQKDKKKRTGQWMRASQAARGVIIILPFREEIGGGRRSCGASKKKANMSLTPAGKDGRI